jgi:Fungal specific transcription factor domain
MPHSNEIAHLSKSNPLITSTILALTASHLRHLSPGNVQHRIAEHFQQYISLKELQVAINKPRSDLGQPGADALLLCAMLLNMHAFALPSDPDNSEELDPGSSWVFSPREDRLGWLALQAGMRPLLLSMAPYLEQSRDFLGQIFFRDLKESWTYMKIGYGLEDVPELWIRVFELESGNVSCDSETTRPGEVFRSPVLILAHLRKLEPAAVNVFKILQFLSKIQHEFRSFLYDRDERALWLFGYWLGLLCRYKGLWWCESRARRDYKAIRLWLESLHLTRRPGLEGQVWRVMMDEFDMAPLYNGR